MEIKETDKDFGAVRLPVDVVDNMNKLMDYLFIRQKLLFIDESSEKELKIYLDVSDLIVEAEEKLWSEIVELMPDKLTMERKL